MDTITGYSYILPELTTEEYLILMFTLNRCKDDIPYGFRIRPLIGKIQAGAWGIKTTCCSPTSRSRSGATPKP